MFLQDCDQTLQENCYNFLARLLQDFYLAGKTLSFSAGLARYVQDLMQDLASLAGIILSKFAYLLQGHFYWELSIK